VRAMLRVSGLVVVVGGGPWWLGAAGVSGYGACFAHADSGNDWLFPARAVDVFLFWIVYSYLSQCILCNGLMLYRLLGGFMLDQASYL